MEDLKKKSTTESDKKIVFSKVIKAGKRIYYLDVKKNRKEEMSWPSQKAKKLYRPTIRKLVLKNTKSFYIRKILKSSSTA